MRLLAGRVQPPFLCVRSRACSGCGQGQAQSLTKAAFPVSSCCMGFAMQQSPCLLATQLSTRQQKWMICNVIMLEPPSCASLQEV